MYPYPAHVLGIEIGVWNLTFLIAVVLAYPIWLRALGGTRPRAPVVRWIVIVYLSAVAAQLFAYAVDLHTTLAPSGAVGWLRYYLDPFAGPKTLYGVILFLPLIALAVSAPWGDLGHAEVLDSLTPPLCVVLAICRFGCFLQGCCYGIRSDLFGVVFPPAGPVYARQLAAGLIAPGGPTLPVVPAQLLEAFILAGLSFWAMRELGRGRRRIFLPVVAAYSTFRLAIEWVRDDPERNFLGPLSVSQWVALLVLGVFVTRRASTVR